jgi:chromosome segregation ATPase
MPKGRRQQRVRAYSWDGEASGAEENSVNSGNDRETNQVNGARPRQSAAPRESRRSGLGPWTEAVRNVVQNMGATHHAIQSLEEAFKSHIDDLISMDETRNTLATLKGECSEKDDRIKNLEIAVEALRDMDSKAKAEIDQSWAEIKKTKEKLGEDETKLEKRIAVKIAQEKLKLTGEIEKLAKDHDRSYTERRRELETECVQLKAEKKQLELIVNKQREDLEARSKELNGAVEQHDLWKTSSKLLKQEKQDLEKELQMMKEELALNSKPKEYLYVSPFHSANRKPRLLTKDSKRDFAGIYCSIERLSWKYFHNIDGKVKVLLLSYTLPYLPNKGPRKHT